MAAIRLFGGAYRPRRRALCGQTLTSGRPKKSQRRIRKSTLKLKPSTLWQTLLVIAEFRRELFLGESTLWSNSSDCATTASFKLCVCVCVPQFRAISSFSQIRVRFAISTRTTGNCSSDWIFNFSDFCPANKLAFVSRQCDWLNLIGPIVEALGH